MALSLGSGRRRWVCRAARRGGKGGAGCRHFHVHYHVPRQVWAFSPLRLPPSFSLLPYPLILPVLFFAVLAFLVCFGWFTLVYFVSSLWSKGNDHELCVSRSENSASDASELRGEDEQEERDVKRVTEYAGDSGLSEVCAESQEIKEVFEDGLSEESWHISKMASPGISIDDKEVVVFETNKEELIAFPDGCSEKDQQVMDILIDCFLEEINTREFSTSLNTAKLLDLPYGEEFVANRKEMSVVCSFEILEFIDKHDTGSDFEIPEVSTSDDSAHHDLRDEQRKAIKLEQSTAELAVNIVANGLAEAIVDEWQERNKLVIEQNNKLPQDDSNEKQTVGISDENHDSLCEMTGLPLDSPGENESESTSVQDGEIEEELIRNKRELSSTSASAVCDFADNHWRIIEQLANEENIHEEDSPETSAFERVEDEDEDIDDNCASMGASHRLPLIRRSPAQWWNLCGVLDVFAGRLN